VDSQNSPTKQTKFAKIEIINSRCKLISCGKKVASLASDAIP